MKNIKFTLLIFLTLGLGGEASTLSEGLTVSDIKRIVEIIGPATVGRMMRSAEPYPSMPGIKLGFEVPLFFGRDINELGDGSGSVSGIGFAPRFHLAKGLFYDLEAIVSFIPTGMLPTPSTFSAIVKFTFLSEEEDAMSAAVYGGYTKIEAFGQGYVGKDLEFGLLGSKDLVTSKPFMGVGFIFASGTVARNFSATDERTAKFESLHFFVGVEWVSSWNITAQLDFMNTTPMASLSLGKAF